MWYIQITYENEPDDIYHFMERDNAEKFLKNKMINMIVAEYRLAQCEFFEGQELTDLVNELRDAIQDKTIGELCEFDFGESMEFNMYPVVVEDIKK